MLAAHTPQRAVQQQVRVEPGVSLRNSLRMYWPPYTSEVLLCSDVIGRARRPVSSSTSGSRSKTSGPTPHTVADHVQQEPVRSASPVAS